MSSKTTDPKVLFSLMLLVMAGLQPVPLSSAEEGRWTAAVKEAVWLDHISYASGAKPPSTPEGQQWLRVWATVTSPGKKDRRLEVQNITIADPAGQSYGLKAASWIRYASDDCVFLFVQNTAAETPATEEAQKTTFDSSFNPPGTWTTIYQKIDKNKFGPGAEAFFEDRDPKKERISLERSMAGDGSYVSLEIASSPMDVVLLFCLPAGTEAPVLHFGPAEPVTITPIAAK